MDNKLIYNLVIKEWDNFMIFNFTLSGIPYYLITNKDKVLIFTHSDRDGNIHEKERVIKYINQFPGREIELICCYPNRAKGDKELGKYIKIDSDRPIQMLFPKKDHDGTFTQYANILEKMEN